MPPQQRRAPRIPEPHGPVPAPAGHPRPVRAERDAPDRPVVPGQHERIGVPARLEDPQGPVAAPGRHPPPVGAERDRLRRARPVAAQRDRVVAAAEQPPHPYGAVGARPRDRRTVGAERQALHRRSRPAQQPRRTEARPRDGPQPDHTVAVACRKVPPVGAERDPELPARPAQHGQRGTAAQRVPDPDGAVVRRGGQPAPVGAERHPPHLGTGGGEGPLRPAAQLPHGHHPVDAAGGHPGGVGAEHRAPHLALVAGQHARPPGGDPAPVARPDPQRPVVAAGGRPRAVRAVRDAEHLVRAGGQHRAHPDLGGGLPQRRLGRGRGPDVDGPPGQEQGQFRLERELLAGRRGEFVRHGQVAFARRAARLHGTDGGEHGDDHGREADQGRRSPRTADAGLSFPRLDAPAGGQERQLGVVEPAGRAIVPGGEPAAPPEERVVAVVLLPLGGGLGEPPVRAQLVAVGGEPAAQPGPAPDQHLVGDSHGPLVAGDQPGGGEPVHHCGGRGDLLVRGVPARVLGALTERGEPQEHVPGDPALVRIELVEDAFRSPGDRLRDPARLPVGRQGEQRALAALPRLQQGVRDQRQRARLPRHVGQHGVDQRRLGHAPGGGGRPGDHRAQLRVGHRPDQHLPVPQRRHQRWVGRAVRIEVGPYADHDPRPVGGARDHGEQALQEQPAGGLVAAEREDLLELVDHEHQAAGPATPRGEDLPDRESSAARVGAQVGVQRRGGRALQGGQRRGQLLQRFHARRQQLARRPERRHQARAQQRRLAAARRAEDGEERVGLQPPGQLGDQRVAAEEQRRVARLERRQPEVGRRRSLRIGRRGGRGSQAVPAALPLPDVAAAATDVGERHRQRGQGLPGGGLGEHRRGVVHARGQHPVARLARLDPQLPQIPGETRYLTGLRVELSFRTPHRTPPVGTRPLSGL